VCAYGNVLFQPILFFIKEEKKKKMLLAVGNSLEEWEDESVS
jgi:hypothetical protein